MQTHVTVGRFLMSQQLLIDFKIKANKKYVAIVSKVVKGNETKVNDARVFTP